MRFAHPHVLWLLLVVPPALMAFLWWAGRNRRRLLTAFVQARLLPELAVGISPARDQLRALLLVGAATALVIALARPQWGFTWQEAHQKSLDVVVAIDTSKSMLADDIAPSRLARAKLAALDLMQTAKSDRLGLVAFAGDAFLECPMTIDESAFRQSVDMLNANTLPQGGTAIAEAIATAQAAFKEGDGYKVLVLFTDGEDHDANAVEAARKAAAAGLRIFTIGIGSPEGVLLPESVRDENGNRVKSRLDETLLKEIARAGQGFYLPLRGSKVIETLYEKGLAPLPRTESEARLYKDYHEQFHWPLALAILLLLGEILLPARLGKTTRAAASLPAANRQTMIALWLAVFLLPHLGWASAAGALRDYQNGHFDKAWSEYERLLKKRPDDARLALNAGTAAYRNGKLDEAATLLSKAATAPDLTLQQRAYYNRGNTRFRQGQSETSPQARQQLWEKSLGDFDSALKLNAQDADAKHNYEFVKQQLEQLKQQQKQQQQQNQQQSKPDQNQNQQQNQQQQNGKQDQQKSDQQKQQEQQQQEQKHPNPQQAGQKHPSTDDQKQQASQSPQDQKKQPPQPSEPTKPEADKRQEQAAEQAPANGQRQGEMSPEQARRFLDAMKGDEQVLPLQKLETPPASHPPAKDW